MFAVTIDTAWFTDLDAKTWCVIAGLAALWLPSFLPAGLWAKVRGLLPSWGKDETPDDEPRTLLDILAELEERRAELQAELARIDKLLGVRVDPTNRLDDVTGTEIDVE